MQNKNIDTAEECIKLLLYISESPTEIMVKLAQSGWSNSLFVNKNPPSAIEEYEHRMSMHNLFANLYKVMGKESEPPVLEEIE